jgi:hypothetical protein
VAEVRQGAVFIVHVSCEGSMTRRSPAPRRRQRVVRRDVHQYLSSTKPITTRPAFEGAKYVFHAAASSARKTSSRCGTGL